ncbi:MAG: tetratricopeptide repeat protein [Spirochaetota bacterium]
MGKQAEIERLINTGKKRLNQQRYKQALECFLDAQKKDPENPDARYFLGITYTRMEDYTKAAQYLEELLHSELNYINRVHTRMVLGYIYTIQENYQDALSMFRGVLEAGFQSAQAYAAIGYIMDRMGNFKEAVMNLYRAIELDPKNANAHNSLGYIFAERGINLEEALEECKKALSADRNNPSYLDSVGWVYFKMGKYQQARSYLNKALKLAPHNQEIKEHLHALMNEHNS